MLLRTDMKRILRALPLFALAGCAKQPYTQLASANEPVLIKETETSETYALVEQSREVLRLSVYTLEDDVEIFHRKWERHEAANSLECIREKAYYMDDEMEVVLTDDACNRTVDSVYLPFQGEFGRGMMSESQRRQADEGMQEIINDLGDTFDFTGEVREWHGLKLENQI